MGMSSAFFPSRNIIQVVYTLYIEREGFAILHNSQITLTIRMMPIELYDRAIKYIIFLHCSSLF